MSKYLHIDPGIETRFLSSDFIQCVSLHYHIMRFHITDGSIFHKEYAVYTKLLGVTSKIILTPINKTDLLDLVFMLFLEDSSDLNV